MNQQQHEFVVQAMQQLTKVVHQCAENSATASAILGRRRVGKHIVVVRIIAEQDEGFAAPLNSHASRSHSGSNTIATNRGPNTPGRNTPGQNTPGKSSEIEPDYSKHTEHHNKNNRVNRWHKPIFDL